MGRLIVQLGVVGRVAFHHVVAKTGIAQVIEQVVEIGLHVLLNQAIGVVQVAESVKVVAGVLITARRIAVVVGFVVAADAGIVGVVPGELVSAFLLVGEVAPAAHTVLVVDYHVLDDAGAALAVGADHGAQLLLGAPARGVVEPETGVVTHRGRLAVPIVRGGLAGVGYPNQTEILRQLVSLGGQLFPIGLLVGVPVESLKHHTAVVGRPAALPIALGAGLSGGYHHQYQQYEPHHKFCSLHLHRSLIILFDSKLSQVNNK